jgi:ABC-type glycerol-3-phosphate transport system substrate-binding protein
MFKLSDVPNKKFGVNLLGHLGTVGQSMGPDRRQAKVHQNGGHMVDPKNDLKSMLDHPKTIEAYEWIRDRIWKDHASPQPDDVPGAPNNLMNPRLQFSGGHIAMWEEGSWGLIPLITDNPSFDWDIVTLPKGPVQRSVLATTDGWAIWAQTRSIDDTWLLFSWFNSDDWYAIQSKRLQPARLSWMPKWISLITETYPKLQGKNLKAFTAAAEQGWGRPWELHRYHQATAKLINDVYEEAVTRNLKPVKDSHIELARQVNEIQAKEHAAAGNK